MDCGPVFIASLPATGTCGEDWQRSIRGDSNLLGDVPPPTKCLATVHALPGQLRILAVCLPNGPRAASGRRPNSCPPSSITSHRFGGRPMQRPLSALVGGEAGTGILD